MKVENKTAIMTTFYGVISVIGGAAGVIALILGLPLLGVGLILFGVAGFGWSCFIRGWFYREKPSKSKE